MGVPMSWFVSIEGRRYGASAPEFGDETLEESNDLHLSFGVSAGDIPQLVRLIGKPATFIARDGREVASLRVEKVDPNLNLMVCKLLEASPLLGRGWWEESGAAG